MDRNCKTCACSFEVRHPTDIGKTQRSCRWNPPFLVRAGNQNTIAAQPVLDDTVCWQWQPPGMKPGDHLLNTLAREVVDNADNPA